MRGTGDTIMKMFSGIGVLYLVNTWGPVVYQIVIQATTKTPQ